MLWLWIIIGCSILLFGIAYGVGCYFYYRAIDIRSDKSAFMLHSKHSKKRMEDLWFYEKSGYEDVYVHSSGLRLHAYQITQQTQHGRWVILVHGYMGCSEDVFAEAKHFYDLGYHVLCVDLRSHGKSEGNVIGFGCLDQQDLIAWITHINTIMHATHIVLYGVSMGAVTVMMCSDQHLLHVEGIIADCGFTTLHAQLKKVVKNVVPYLSANVLIACLKLVMKHKAGYRIQDCKPIEHVRKADIPMLFLHGDRDAFIPCSMMEELSQAYPSKACKHLIRGGRHANSSKVASKVYWEYIEAFLKQYALL